MKLARHRIGLTAALAALFAVCAIGAPTSALASGSPALAFAVKGPVGYALNWHATLTGMLSGETTVSGRVVEIRTLSGDGVSWSTTATCVTDASGHFATAVMPKRITTFSAALADEPALATGRVTVVPRPAVTQFTGGNKVKRGGLWIGSVMYKTTGASIPAAYRVVLERWERHRWRRKQAWRGAVMALASSPQPDGVYEVGNPMMMHKFAKRGSWRIRIEFPATAMLGAAHSKWLHVKVR